jgi:hypothetical protein
MCQAANLRKLARMVADMAPKKYLAETVGPRSLCLASFSDGCHFVHVCFVILFAFNIFNKFPVYTVRIQYQRVAHHNGLFAGSGKHYVQFSVYQVTVLSDGVGSQKV